jgi:hypothetical protein
VYLTDPLAHRYLSSFLSSSNLTVVRALRLLRAVRLLRLLKRTSLWFCVSLCRSDACVAAALRVIFETLVASVPLMANAFLLFILAMYVLAVLGMYLFAGSLHYRCANAQGTASVFLSVSVSLLRHTNTSLSRRGV